MKSVFVTAIVLVLALAVARGLSAQDTAAGLAAADARYVLFETDAPRTETIDSVLRSGQPDVIEVRNRGDARLRVTVMSAEFTPRVVAQGGALGADRIALRTGFDPLELRTHGVIRLVVDAERRGRGAGYRIRVEREAAPVSPRSSLPTTELCDAPRILQVVRSNVPAITACHTAALLRDRDVHGRIVAQFRIDSVGVVHEARAVEDTVNDPVMTACVLDVIGRLRFDTACVGGSGQFSFPFVFVPQN